MPIYFEGNCVVCGKKLHTGRKYCSNACQAVERRTSKVTEGGASPRTLRRFLLETEGRCCSVCNLLEWNGEPIPLEVDHINGNPEDNQLTNLRLICPNCHAQTDTYKGRNKGNGRFSRRKRYHEGKSF